MRDILTVIKFTMRDMLTRKSFIISTIIILVLIVLGFNVPNILKAFGGEDFGTQTVLISDQDQVFDHQLEALQNAETGYKIELENLGYEEIQTKLEDGDINAAILVEKTDDGAKIRYIVENAATTAGLPESLDTALSTLYTSIQINKLGLTDKQLASLVPNFEYTLEQTQEEVVSSNIFVMMLMSVVLFYAIYFCAFQVSSSITTEKTSKIMETLVTSTSPRTIVLGKTIGIGIVGLIQMLIFLIVAVLSAYLFLGTEVLSSVLDLSHITISLGLITILYFILGYFAYAFGYALTGSTVSKPEDIQSANTPIAILAMVGFYLAYFTMTDPTGDLNIFASLFPFSSPFCMPFRVMMGLASGWDLALSIIILVATILVVAHIAIKIYSNAIFNYGSKMSLGEILKAYKQK